ncbi:MAG: LPS-assembly protein LptD [Bacteroidales bacterium]|nr:LPS-assembly protein LptD [Bacteroidales bacterium]
MADGKYTTCDADHPHFYLALSKGKVIPGDQVVFGPAHMVLLDVPLPIVLPFGFFPQNNKESVSGVLFPSIGMEVSRGLSATNGGYYFAFNDNFDAQVRGDIYSSGTWKVNVLPRYMKRYKYSGNLNFNYGVTIAGEKGLDRTETKQYSIQWTHTQDAKANPNQNFSASVNYSSTSFDKEFNYTNPSMLYTNTKNSSISYRKNWPNTPFRLTANFNHSQSQNAGAEMITFAFPTINFSMDRVYPFKKKESIGKAKWYEDITLTYNADLKNTLSGKEGEVFKNLSIHKMQNGFQHSIPLSKNFKVGKFFNITPSMNYKGVLYANHVKRYFREDSITAGGQKGVMITDTIPGMSYAHSLSPTLSIGATPKFYLMNVYGPNSKVEAIRTVISPSATFSYVPNMSGIFNYYENVIMGDKNGDAVRDANGNTIDYVDNNGRTPQYSKFDRYIFGTPTTAGKSGSISVGLNGNVEMKVRDDKDSTGVSKKVKLLDRIDARSTYNLFGDSMKWGNISLAASTTIAGVNLTVSGQVDPYKLTPAGTRIDEFGPRLTNINFNTGITLPFKKEEKKDDKGADKNQQKSSGDYDYFDVPWNLTIGYTLGYSKPQFDGRITQNLNFSGSVTLTPKWSLNFQSAYDFDAKQISYMTANITRDLHCWTMSLNFAPFGISKYFFFQINVKSGALQDLKYEKRKSQSDFGVNLW